MEVLNNVTFTSTSYRTGPLSLPELSYCISDWISSLGFFSNLHLNAKGLTFSHACTYYWEKRMGEKEKIQKDLSSD